MLPVGLTDVGPAGNNDAAQSLVPDERQIIRACDLLS
jgi:hypothetical protein